MNFSNGLRSAGRRIRRFHHDERGDAFQNIMILCAAAVVIVGLIYLANGGLEQISKFIKSLFSDNEPPKIYQG
jgi:hypothetical protein